MSGSIACRERYFERLNSGLWVPEGAARRRRPVAIDLFCGAGGFSVGLIMGGFEVIAACDNDPAASLTYIVNLGNYPINIHYIEPGDKERLNKVAEKEIVEKRNGLYFIRTAGSGWISGQDVPGVSHFFFGDIRKLSGRQILDAISMEPGEVDLVAGGPPCQGFSMSGKRDIMDPRNSLVFEFARLVLEIRPKMMVMENVPGILSMVTPEGVPVVDAFCRVLEDGGFGSFDALKRSLLHTAGAGAALRGAAKKEKGKAPSGDTRKKGWKPAAAEQFQLGF